MIALLEKLYRWLITIGNALRSPVLLLIRLFWGWQFFLTGKGKLMDLSKPTQYFDSLGIPFPHAQAILVACTECFGGLLLLVGLASRLVSVPLMILLTVAYITTESEAVRSILTDPDKFTSAAPFLFLSLPKSACWNELNDPGYHPGTAWRAIFPSAALAGSSH
jgi:putative oxidoreductase